MSPIIKGHSQAAGVTKPVAAERRRAIKNHASNAMNEARYIFGPVPSRRLGRSLGIDLVPPKTCMYDCIYCQLGRTTNKTVERKEWVPLEEVIGELKAKLATRPDYITLSGSGEPTLYSRIAELIDRIHSITDIPVAVLSNGSLLWKKEVRDEIAEADVVIPSLDAGGALMFEAVNRPHKSISFAQMLEGLVGFRQEYTGQYWLEVVLLGGYTALASEVNKLAACAKKIAPDRVQLNTVTRPPAEKYAVYVERNRLHEFANCFDPPAEVIADFRSENHYAACQTGCEDIMRMLVRRPCTVVDIASGLEMHLNEVVKYLEELMALKKIEHCRVQDKTFYRAT